MRLIIALRVGLMCHTLGNMKRVLLSATCFAVLFVAGCKPGRSLVGTWDISPAPAPGVEVSTIEFKGDGTLSMTLKGNQGGMNVTVLMTGKYKLEADKLSQTLQDVKFEGIPKELEPMAKQQMANAIGKTDVSTVQWTNDDEITATMSNGNPMTLKRRKS